MAKHFGNRARKSRFSSLRASPQRLKTNRSQLQPIAPPRTARIARDAQCQWLHRKTTLVVERFGDGSAALGQCGHGRLLGRIHDEPAPRFNTLALPTAAGSGNTPNPLTISGNSTTEGQITRSVDGKVLTVPGYAVRPQVAGSNVPGSSTTTATGGGPILRDVGVIDGNGNIDTRTTTTDYSGTTSAWCYELGWNQYLDRWRQYGRRAQRRLGQPERQPLSPLPTAPTIAAFRSSTANSITRREPAVAVAFTK